MADTDAFELNILGVGDLVGSDTNKVSSYDGTEEGIQGDLTDELALDMTDEELLDLKSQWENDSAPYLGKIEPRQKQNKAYLMGRQKQAVGIGSKTVPSNLLFEATATFVPQALAKNPEPVVFSDNTDEGKQASEDLKTMLQYHADTLGLRQKLGVMVWQWGVYFTAVLKHGWNEQLNDIDLDVRKPKNMLFDPSGFVNEFGEFTSWTGERIQATAQEVCDKFHKHEDYIKAKVGGKMGTQIVYTEWWTDEYCFTTFEEKVLDKHKNEFFNYDADKPNHFAKPKKPYTFLSVFTLQEQPHDFTNLIEQNIANQDSINERDKQIEKNLAHANNSLIMDDKYFTSETAHQGADAMERGDPLLGNPEGVKRLPAPPLPSGVLEAQESKENKLRSIYGTNGLSSQPPDDNTTARGMILNQSHDSTRIGGGIGDSLEQVAKNVFNWQTQLYYKFYDEKHYAAIMGQASAVSYVALMMVGHNRKFVVSVAPDSMQPKDEVSQINNAVARWAAEAIDPIGFMKEMNSSDPLQDAERLTLWVTNKQLYAQKYFPDLAQPQQQQGQPGQGAPPGGGNPPQPEPPGTLSASPANASLSNVPLPK